MVKRISPQEAKDLIDREGYVYVDVRSIPEFEQGHPTGAFNVPLNHMGPAGMAPNPEFVAVMEEAFPKDAKLVLGCQGGGRSLRAAGILEQAGFTNVVDNRAGFQGHAEPGWRPAGLPVSTEAPADHTYEGLKTRPRSGPSLMSEEGLRPDEGLKTRPRSGPSLMSEEGLRPDERKKR